MPKTKTDLTPAEYAVLGLLRERPTHGYELKRQFATAGGLGRVCPVEPAMVYAILRSLSGLELIDGTWDDSSTPRRSVYTVTEEGDQIFARWLRRPVARIREVRLDFMVKMYFALREDRQLAHELVEAQIDEVRNYAGRVARERDALAPDADEFDVLVLGSRASAAQITMEWLERYRSQASTVDAAHR